MDNDICMTQLNIFNDKAYYIGHNWHDIEILSGNMILVFKQCSNCGKSVYSHSVKKKVNQ